MRTALLFLALGLGLPGSARGDEVQAARDRALALLNRSIALSGEVARDLRPDQSRAEIFAVLLKANRQDGSSVGVYDADSRRVAWVGSPIDPLRLPEVDPSAPARFVAATRSRAALVVTEKGAAPWFVLVSTPLLETRRGEGDSVEVVDVLDPSRKLGLDYSDRSVPASGDHSRESIAALGVVFARISPHSPETHGASASPATLPVAGLVLFLIFLSALGATYRFARLGFARPRPFALALLCILSALSVTALIAEFAARAAERDAARREVESVLRAHLRPLESTLAATERVIDQARLFETSPAGRFGTEELAFDLWSDSTLSQPFLPSFVEVLDRSGTVVSRYARDVPRGPKPPLPTSGSWTRSATLLDIGDLAQARGLVSERLLLSSGELLGAVRIGAVSDLNMALRMLSEEKGVRLIAMRGAGGEAIPDPATFPSAAAGGIRIEVPVDQRTYVFELPSAASSAPGRTVGVRLLVDGLLLVAIALGLGAWIGNRERTRAAALGLFRRHSFRLFVAFLTLSALSLFFFQTLVRDFVAQRLVSETETEARRIAAIARKSLSDLSAFQEAEVLGPLAISDAAISWVAALVSNDLELFDDSGELVATNVREDVDAGLLSRLAPSDAYSRLVLADEDMMFHRPPGGLVPSAVSARLVLPAGRTGVVRVNLQNREAQVAAVLNDLDTRMRIAALSLLAVATMLAWFLARRISGPVLEMTEASRRIAHGDLSVRVPVRTGDEVGELAHSFNTMAHDLARQQREIERRERLAAWADMAAQVAHEVKNPLTPIQLSAEHLQRAYRASGIVSEAFESVVAVCTRTILESVTKLRDIASEFAAFVREPVDRSERVEMSTLTRSVIKPYQDVLPEGLKLQARFGPDCPVLGETKLIERAIRNLFENAVQAVGSAGEIRVSCLPAREFAELIVEDTGPGFDEETRARLFEPFFSTKTQGSGLGLALVKKVAEDLGGSASLERDGGITRAVFRLPLAAG
ncbi:MAG: HAMP domain-containing protein [Vicinamibacteria bacterium]|nr:HAMP domain-containing protein [Vicinamibacteria bacterium]